MTLEALTSDDVVLVKALLQTEGRVNHVLAAPILLAMGNTREERCLSNLRCRRVHELSWDGDCPRATKNPLYEAFHGPSGTFQGGRPVGRPDRQRVVEGDRALSHHDLQVPLVGGLSLGPCADRFNMIISRNVIGKIRPDASSS